MIQVQKLPTAPAILRNRGQRTTDEYKAAYNEDPVSYQQGGKKFEFDSSLYGAKSVKKALKKAQHSKCCFCEAKVDHVAYGDIEHFRPKKGYRQEAADALGRPGYYWLAYHWPNLYYSCQICNQRYKRNLFPLVDPAKRAVDHNDDLAEEYALFVDPGMPGPENHISFRQEVTFPVNGSTNGKASIDGLGLNRPEVLERRLERLTTLRLIKTLAEMAGPESADAQAYLEKAVKDDAEYASMTRAFLTNAAD